MDTHVVRSTPQPTTLRLDDSFASEEVSMKVCVFAFCASSLAIQALDLVGCRRMLVR